MNSILSKKQYETQRKIYDRQIDDNVGNFKDIKHLQIENWMQSYLNRLFESFAKFGLDKDSRILDIGCGAHGWIPTTAIQKGFFPSYGVDLSFKAVHYASEFSKNSLFQRYPFFLPASADNLCFTDETFDAVTCIALLEHVVEDQAVIREMARVLKKNGVVYIVVPNDYKRIPIFLRWYYRRADKKHGHLRHYSRNTLEKTLSACGFGDIKFVTTGHFVKMFQYLLSLIFPFTKSPDSKIWWFLENLDVEQRNNDHGLVLTAIAQKK